MTTLRIQKRLNHVASSYKPKTGILMFNLGGPQTVNDVKPFLTRLFSDPDLIELPFTKSFPRLEKYLAHRYHKALPNAPVHEKPISHIQKQFADLIVKRRVSKIEKQYQAIGGGSPIYQWTQTQMNEMVGILDKECPDTAPHKGYVAFRYAEPLTYHAVKQAYDDGVENLIGFTQYPQYSCSTTGSSLNELSRCLNHIPKDVKQKTKLSFIDRWPTHQGLVDAFAHLIEKKLQEFDEKNRDDVLIIFSAHSLPLYVVERGDVYPNEVASTVQAVMQKLQHKNPYRLTWQSKVGPAQWLSPQTADVIDKLGKKKTQKNILLVPIAFTSDHIETLYELDIELMEDAEKHGLNVKRCDSLNDNEIFIRGMADLVKNHINQIKNNSGPRWSKQLEVQCPGCTKDSCHEMRKVLLQ